MAQARLTDEARFVRIYEAHAQRVLRYCAFRLGTRTDAEDAAAETFARLLTSGGRVIEAGAEPWLITVASRVCTDVQRRGRRETPVADPPDESAQAWDAEPAWVDPAVREAVRSLTPKQQLVVFMRVIEDLPFADIARACGGSEPSVRMTWHRAAVSLRKALAGGGS